MGVDSAEAPKANGFKTVLDTIIAPKEAFESLRTTPTWGWAFVITLILTAIGTFLMAPAFSHAFAAGWPEMVAKDPRLAQLSAADQQAALARLQSFFGFSWSFVIISVPFGVLVQTLIFWIFNWIGKGEGTFGKYWAAACNISVPAAGLGAIVFAIIILVRGVDSFDSIKAVQTASLSLAMLVPNAGVKLAAFLSAITPFSLWGAGLIIAAMLIIGRVPRVQAWLAGIISLLVPAVIAMAAAH